jgi:hypothetical protein
VVEVKIRSAEHLDRTLPFHRATLCDFNHAIGARQKESGTALRKDCLLIA